MPNECSPTWGDIIEIIGITLSLVAFIYEVLAARSRDSRASSPLQFIITGISVIIYKISGKKLDIYANKSDIKTRDQLLEDLIAFAEKLHKDETWITQLRENRSIRSIRSISTVKSVSARRSQDIFENQDDVKLNDRTDPNII